MISKLSDEHLVEAYFKAKRLKLNESFIMILAEELNRRGIKINREL